MRPADRRILPESRSHPSAGIVKTPHDRKVIIAIQEHRQLKPTGELKKKNNSQNDIRINSPAGNRVFL